MKGKTPYILLLVGIALVLLIANVYNKSHSENDSNRLAEETSSPPKSTQDQVGGNQDQMVATQNLMGNEMPTTKTQIRELLDQGMSLDELVNKLYTQKLTVHGIVLDQNNHSVADAKIKYRLYGPNDFVSAWTEAPEYEFAQTDSEGRFVFSGIGGAFYAKFVSHPECIKTSGSSLTISAINQPSELGGINFDNPVTLRVFRTGKKMPLYVYRPTVEPKVEHGKTYYLDFKIGKYSKQPTGHALPIRLIGSVYGSSLEYVDDKSYKFGIEIGDQGNNVQIAPAREEDYRIAPLEGYHKSQVLGELTDSKRKKKSLSFSYFVKFEDSTHGYIKLGTSKGKIYYEIYYNPKPESRNLNFDPEIAIVNK